MFTRCRWSSVAVLFLALAVEAGAQTLPPNLTKEDLARDNNLFLSLARKVLKWDEPTDPVKIAGPLYFVGTRGLSSWLFVTTEGNILLNTGMPGSGPMIADSIRKLGFKPEDITHLKHELLKPDIWLGHHTEYFDLDGKRQRAQAEGVKAWVDPEGYRRFVAGKKRAFEDEVDVELDVPKKAAQ